MAVGADAPGSRPPALLVVNARSRRGGEVAERAAEALRAAGVPVLPRESRERESLSDLIRRARGEVGSVILGGGDGTLHAAAPALRETGLPLGILPLGTANDLARTLGIPPDLDAAVGVIARGHVRAIDLGSVNGVLFFNVASLGLSVDITRRLTKVMKRRWGKLAYPIAAGLVISTSRRFSAEIVADGERTRVKTMQIAVGNGRFYGGGMVVEEHARIDDHALDVYSLEPRARWRLLLMARAFRAGQHEGQAEVRHMRCREVEVRTRRPRSINTDGEITTRTPAVFRVVPGAVRVFAPPPEAPGDAV